MTSQSTCAKQAGPLALGGLLLMLFPALEWAQHSQPPASAEEGARALWDTTFLSRRPAARQPSRPAEAQQKAAPASAPASFFGITLWRLRRSLLRDEPGVRLLVHDEEFTAQRIGVGTPLAEGQLVRIGVESAQAGHLYVVDQEQHADGSLGDPYLVFPTLKTRGGNNQVAPGTLIEIPAWNDDPPYLRLVRSGPNHVGELLTFLVTPQPLPELRIGEKPLLLTHDEVAAWGRKWGAPARQLEAREQVAKSYTAQEKAAASDGRPLTQDDPAPQTLFRVEVKSGEPVLVSVPLPLRK